MLRPTEFYGRVTYLGVVLDREVTLRSEPREQLELTYEGPVGECHGGLTRPSCSRVKLQYPKGTEIANARQLSMLSVEELAAVSEAMGIDGIEPEWTGANIIFEGIPDFTQIPPSSRLIFENGASLVSDMENGPCKFVGQEIEREYPGKGLAFPKLAMNRRGVCGWVERTGVIEVGMTARLHIPPQRIWSPAA
ncbi:MAG: sulfurase [Pseudomonadota bacterium]